MLEAKERNKYHFSRKDQWTVRNKTDRGGSRDRRKKREKGKKWGREKENIGREGKRQDILFLFSTFQFIRHSHRAEP